MPSKRMARTAYRDPTLTNQPVRSGFTSHGESNLDAELLIQPLEQVHGSGLHDWGVGQGLRTTATLGAPGITIELGIAIDGSGRHISLAPGTTIDPNYAEIATTDPPVPSVPAIVNATGVTLPTATAPLLAAGDYYVAVQFLEALDQAALGNPTGPVWRLNHTPWFRLLSPVGFTDDGSQVVLAKVHLDAAGNVTSLSHDVRRAAGLPAQSVRLRGAQSTSAAGKTSSAETDAAELRVRRDAGGVPAGAELVTSKTTDEVHVKAKGVGAGTFAPVAKVQLSATTITARNAAGVDTVTVESQLGNVIAANRVVAPTLVGRRADGRETVIVDAQLGNVVAGTEGVEGDVLVKDTAGTLVITLDGAKADVVVGGTNNSGNVRVWNAQRAERINLDGSVGDMFFAGALRDTAWPAHAGVNNAKLRELTGAGYTSLHRHFNSGNAAWARGTWLFADNSTDVQTISFGSPRRMMASICINAMDPRAGFDRGDGFFAEIYRVDGNDYHGWYYWGGDHLGSDGADANTRFPFFQGTASSITFRLRSTQDAAVWALAMVIPEDAF
ncbi:MAG TPA: hypothetical protein VFI52_05515 [Gemmatimonadaceae bacterium]|nr:hypothetical protein [Gemmatimonadaceae bacterium]